MKSLMLLSFGDASDFGDIFVVVDVVGFVGFVDVVNEIAFVRVVDVRDGDMLLKWMCVI